MSEVRSVSSTGGEKGVKAQRHDLLPRPALDRISEVYAFGAEKYADHNWRRRYEWSKSYAALQRHITAWWDGVDLDPESGLSHLGHAGFHIFALLTWLDEQGSGVENPFDDRWPYALERADRAEGDPATYGEALERTVQEFTRGEATAQDVGWAAEDVEAYGADSEYPLRGMTRERYDAQQAAVAARLAARQRRMDLALDELEAEEPLSPGASVCRGGVLDEDDGDPDRGPDGRVYVAPMEAEPLGKGWENLGWIRDDDTTHPDLRQIGTFAGLPIVEDDRVIGSVPIPRTDWGKITAGPTTRVEDLQRAVREALKKYNTKHFPHP